MNTVKKEIVLAALQQLSDEFELIQLFKKMIVLERAEVLEKDFQKWLRENEDKEDWGHDNGRRMDAGSAEQSPGRRRKVRDH